MKVLSIDFDYFEDTDADTVMNYFPDGIDLPTAISNVVWIDRYAEHEEKIRKVGIRLSEFEKVKSIINNQSRSCIAMIVNSHRHIYDLVRENTYENESLHIVNLDMHHDMFNDNELVDCGNWVNHLRKEYKQFEFQWIDNPISKEVFGLDDESFNKVIEESTDCIKDTEFDMVFLCRSDNWTPPHLDKYFIELCNIMKNRFYSIRMEKGVDVARQYEEESKAFRKTIEGIRGKRSGK